MKTIKTAEIICVGTELLLGEVINTNASDIASRVSGLGINIYRQSVVGDNEERLTEAVKTALSRADLVILTGGLGPTCDDITKETVTKIFGYETVLHAPSFVAIKEYFRKIGKKMTENNVKQAMMPKGAEVFFNDFGTAPGLALSDKKGEKTAILLPGPPREMLPMLENSVIPYLSERTSGVIYSENLYFLGIGESELESLLRPIMERSENPTVAPYVNGGEVRVRVTASGRDEESCRAAIAPVIDEIKKTPVAKYLCGVDIRGVEDALISALREKKLTLALAESCTGGLAASRIVNLSGCSDVFLGSAVTYANSAKEGIIGVSDATLKAHGAVSPETAREMAAGARKAYGADIAISVTGVAGPDGGTAEKPVGLVYIGYSDKNGDTAEECHFFGRDRAYIRNASATRMFATALEKSKANK